MSLRLPPPEKRRFIIDQNFPVQVEPLPWPQTLTVARLSAAYPHLVADVEDWEILLELEFAGERGFVTNDARILDSPREMVSLQHTRLQLVVTDGVGNDPLKASGLLMVHLPDIERESQSGGVYYRVTPTGKHSLSAGKRVNLLATRRSLSPPELIAAETSAVRVHLTQFRPHLLTLLGE